MEIDQIKRCAVYSRKSHEEGLDQDFNSLDAQRESAENYISSQKLNGWQLLPDRYDDGGFSGGTTDRPALKQLMADVEAGKIDIIVVYKLDRLSRSLLDFMNMADFFERHNVSFVSVTQEINTSTSAGRMMLNILMTFAQYEREVIAERIRDKIAGAKRRGKFCGGTPVLGYSANKETKKLEVVHREAQIVKEAFSLYSKLGSAKEVARALNEKGYHTKEWKTRKGKIRQGENFKPDMVYRILNNPLYIGNVPHKDKIYPGEHQAIIGMDEWKKTQQLLSENLVASGRRCRTMTAPFKGLLKCGYCGGAMGITFSKKAKARYYYYLCEQDSKRIDRECPLVRVPAGDVDRIILRQLSELFRSPALLSQIYMKIQGHYLDKRGEFQTQLKEVSDRQSQIRSSMKKNYANETELTKLCEQLKAVERERLEIEGHLHEYEQEVSGKEITETLSSLDALWDELFPAERYRLAHLLIDKITLFEDKMLIDIKIHGMRSLVSEIQAGNPNCVTSGNIKSGIISLTVPVVLKHRNNRRVMLLPAEDPSESSEALINNTLVQALAKANIWFGMLERGEVFTIQELANRLKLGRPYVGRILNLVNLAPKIQDAIINGREPDGLTLRRLRDDLPLDWQKQMDMFAP